MKNMTLSQIAKACNGKLFASESDVGKEVAGVVMDSRQVEQDYLFIATVGERVDGHSFISKVYEKGALAVVCEKAPVEAKGAYILVDNSLTALKSIAMWYRSLLTLKVIGITGSVGKTSTKEFISSVLATKYQVLKTEGNYNNEIGMPLTLLKIRDHHEVAVLEMGISDFGEMHRLSEIAKPDICVITNIGQCHLENLKSREGILKAKTEIFDFMQEDGYVCLNGDDDMLATIQEVHGHKPVYFGLGSTNPISASEINTKGLFGTTCKIKVTLSAQVNHVNVDQAYEFLAEIPLPGEHMVLNALAATSVGSLLGLSKEEIAQGIAQVKPVGGRSNILRKEQWTIIDDCYNANPVSMKAAIDLLTMADTNKVAILGDMFELGTNEKELHKEVGAYAASKVDVLVCVGKLSENMRDGAKEALELQPSSSHSHPMQLMYYATREEMLEALPMFLQKEDTVLVKASHGMGFDQVVKALLEI